MDEKGISKKKVLFFCPFFELRTKTWSRINRILFCGEELKDFTSFRQNLKIFFVDAAYVIVKENFKNCENIVHWNTAQNKGSISFFSEKKDPVVFEGESFFWYFFFEDLLMYFWAQVLKSVFFELLLKKKRTSISREKIQPFSSRFFLNFWRNYFFRVRIVLVK